MKKFEEWFLENNNTNHKYPLLLDQDGFYHHPETRLAYLAYYALIKENQKPAAYLVKSENNNDYVIANEITRWYNLDNSTPLYTIS